MSRGWRVGIGLVALLPIMGIAGGLLVAAGVEGLTVGWITLGIGIVWVLFVVWWMLRAPESRASGQGEGIGWFRHDRFGR